ncbi:aminoglycoside phosphotransferase family protein [Paenibacillus agricola]|uniref:Phosphotransferase n=1 Tax=Paenibacillus agricola TaxID=2716264 RepID=A0ABX0JDU3_9BACL|nr:aminoglycoside phosphotransferase family protein [Paenibacillus agricola]NHN33951.1 phosphotransferase [Paenibacillus agricola]
MDLAAVQLYMPTLSGISHVSKVERGFSFDSKYFLSEANHQPAFVLRTAPLSQYVKKQAEYEVIQRVYDLGVKTSEPILFGTIEALELSYMVLRYVDGEEAAERLPTLTGDQQYQIGVNAGSELRLMHGLEAPAGLEAWHVRRQGKYLRHLAAYTSCGVQFDGEAKVNAFIGAHLQLMKDRPNRFQHDDFHPSNLLVKGESYSGVIDFNRYDWGDPYQDFLKIAYFSREVSVPFCIGQIHGYFDNKVPDSFWGLYALYTAMNLYPTLTWTLEVVPKQLESMKKRMAVVLEDHLGFERIIPTWYRNV